MHRIQFGGGGNKSNLARSVVLRSHVTKRNVYYMHESENVRGYVSCREQSVFSPFAKIEIELSKFNNKYVHLRFSHSNKYWGRRPNDKWILASSDQPVEELSKPSCTLFEPRYGNDKNELYFTHVQSGGHVRVADTVSGSMNSCIYVDVKGSSSYSMFTFVDCDTLVKLPKYITFKGDNGKYLKAIWHDRCRPYLQFSGDDFNHEYVAYEVFSQPDGHVRIKSLHFNKFWRRSPNWIWGDSSDTNGNNLDTLFWPVKVDGRTIALRNAGNKAFCVRLTTEGKTSCLNAAVNYITREARMVVEELVLERSIYNVRYRMEDARIYDAMPFVVGIGTATNNSDSESTLAINVSYVDTSSSSFSNSLSLDLGVKATIQTGIPYIADGKIEVSASVTKSFESGETTTTSKTSEATYTCKVPPRTRATVNYVGTKGKCNVPFSYYQRDKRSSDGSYVTSQHVDGIFNGVNYYSYRFEQLKFEPI